MFETAADRAALAGVWGDSASVGASTILGQYDEPQAEDLMVEGTAPTFLAQRSDLEAAGVTYQATVDSVTTHDGRTRGPFTVVRWQSQDDGAFVVLGLQVS